ncbi:hypothetical protein VNO77_19477 [Canavalia gladiata]|uniref:Uncharacterized protein n=1 Tax=Canavalia gladiata TaxID=3824 RepID=A0AAN9LR07_CANGL
MTSRFCQSLILGILFVALVLSSEPATADYVDLPPFVCKGKYGGVETCRPNCKGERCNCVGGVSGVSCCCSKR